MLFLKDLQKAVSKAIFPSETYAWCDVLPAAVDYYFLPYLPLALPICYLISAPASAHYNHQCNADELIVRRQADIQ